MYPKFRTLFLMILRVTLLNSALAGEVVIVGAEFQSSGANQWSVDVTLRHADTGWEHYADNWQVVDAQGKVLGDRVLYHPHADEQPFTRSLAGVNIPAGVTTVFITAHDKKHGWSRQRLLVDLSKADSGRLRVEK